MVAKQPRDPQEAYLASLEEKVPSLQEKYRRTGRKRDRLAIEENIRIGNKLRGQINKSR